MKVPCKLFVQFFFALISIGSLESVHHRGPELSGDGGVVLGSGAVMSKLDQGKGALSQAPVAEQKDEREKEMAELDSQVHVHCSRRTTNRRFQVRQASFL